MLQPASFNKPFIVGVVGREKISITPLACEFCWFSHVNGDLICFRIKSSSSIFTTLRLVVVVAVDDVDGFLSTFCVAFVFDVFVVVTGDNVVVEVVVEVS